MELPARNFDSATISTHYQTFWDGLVSPGLAERSLGEHSLECFYKSAGLDAPAIIWCKSYYQLLTLPSLLIGLLHSDIWDLIHDEAATRTEADSWSNYWQTIWPEILTNSVLPLLDGMYHTSRLAVVFPGLEDGLLEQAELEFGRALQSGRLDHMQHKLKRELYRRFWAPHEREIGKSILSRSKFDGYNVLAVLTSENPDWRYWRLISELDQSTMRAFEQVDSLFDRIADTVGMEARNQANHILDLPAGIPWLPTASLLWTGWPRRFHSYSSSLQMLLDLSANTSAIMCLDGVAFICERPSVFQLDDALRLHSESGPALVYSDGLATYAWQGIFVPDVVVDNPDSLSVEMIENERNVAVRRVMLERYGLARFIEDAGVVPIHSDDFGTLYRRDLADDEPLVLLKVVNATAEPDGTFRDYFLRVPPSMQTAREAVAWTFAVDPDDYIPDVQT